MPWHEAALDTIEVALSFEAPTVFFWRFDPDYDWLQVAPIEFGFSLLDVSKLISVFDQVPEMNWGTYLSNEFNARDNPWGGSLDYSLQRGNGVLPFPGYVERHADIERGMSLQITPKMSSQQLIWTKRDLGSE